MPTFLTLHPRGSKGVVVGANVMRWIRHSLTIDGGWKDVADVVLDWFNKKGSVTDLLTNSPVSVVSP